MSRLKSSEEVRGSDVETLPCQLIAATPANGPTLILAQEPSNDTSQDQLPLAEKCVWPCSGISLLLSRPLAQSSFFLRQKRLHQSFSRAHRRRNQSRTRTPPPCAFTSSIGVGVTDAFQGDSDTNAASPPGPRHPQPHSHRLSPPRVSNFSADFTVIKSFFMAFSRRTETIQLAATFVGVFIGTYVVCYAFDMIDSQLWAKAKQTLNVYLYYALDMAVNLTCYQVARIICGMFIRNIKLKQHKVQIVLLVSVVSGLISTLAFYAMSMTALIRLPHREVAAMWHFAEVVLWRIAFEIVGHWLDSEMKAPRSQIARYFRRHVILLVRLFCAKVVSYPVTHNLANIFDESINYLMKQPRYWLIDDFKAGFVTLVMKMC